MPFLGLVGVQAGRVLSPPQIIAGGDPRVGPSAAALGRTHGQLPAIIEVQGCSANISIGPTAVASLADTWPTASSITFDKQPEKSIVTNAVVALNGLILPALTGNLDTRRGLHASPEAPGKVRTEI